MIQTERFERIKNKIVAGNYEGHGIGTLSEKTVHAVLKEYYEPDIDCHEVPVEGYVADIYNNGNIIEIQNGNFNKMRNKLDTFLPEFPVTIVYPMVYTKWLIWIDEETGQLTKKRKSNKKGNFFEAFIELYKIKSFLNHPNLRIKIAMIDVEEFRLLNGWSKDRKKGSRRYDRIPIELVTEYDLDCVKDYMQFVPFDMPNRFTSKDYAKAAKISADLARTALNILTHLQIVNRIGKIGNTILYEVAE